MLILPPLGATTSWLCTSKAAMACNCLVARSVRSSCIFTTNALKEAGWHADISNARLEESHGITKIQQQKRGSMVVISLLYAAIVVRLDGGYIYIYHWYINLNLRTPIISNHMGMGFSNLVPPAQFVEWAEWVSLGTFKSSIFRVILLTYTQPISAFPPSKWWFMMASYWRWAAKYTGLGVLEFWPSPNVQWTSLVFGRGRSVVSLSGLRSPPWICGAHYLETWIILDHSQDWNRLYTVDTHHGYILLAT